MYHVMQVEPADFNIGGTEQFIIKNAQYLDQNKFAVHFLCCGHVNEQKEFERFQDFFQSADAFHIDYGIMKPWKILFRLRKYLKNHPCDIVHIHNGFVSNMTVCALAAKLAGVRHIICHLHGTDLSYAHNPIKSFIKTVRKKLDLQILSICATDFFTCSQKAARLTYGDRFVEKKSVRFFPNAIDVCNYYYQPEKRKSIREQYHLKNQFVVGTVGRLSKEKNQLFLVDIFSEILKKCDDAVLMMVGEGPGKPEIQEKIRQMGLEDKVILTGSVSNVNDYLQAFDAFVLPSFTEAFPIVMVEAQAAGLPVIVSDVITEETAITSHVEFIGLNESAGLWSERILTRLMQANSDTRGKESICDAFDIQKSGKNLENIYLSMIHPE